MTTTSFSIGGELTVRRLGLGAMRLAGAWGAEPGPGDGRELLRDAVRRGVQLIDTARTYGDSETLIADALHPYPDDLVIATKGGLNSERHPDGRPQRLRADVEESLRRLRVDVLDLWQLHQIDPAVPLEEQLGTVRELRDEGKIRFVGLSEVTPDELRRARELVEIATVQNRYNVAERDADELLAICARDGIGFLPWAPVRVDPGAPVAQALAAVAARRDVSPTQVALAWLLARSPVIAPIPGTASIEHMRDNLVAADLILTEADLQALG